MPPRVAKEARKLQRVGKTSSGKQLKKQLKEAPAVKRAEAPDPLSAENLKKMFGRLAIPVVAVWAIGILVAGFSTSKTTITIALAIPGVVTLAIAGMVVGLTFTAGYIVYFKFISPEANVAANWLFGISPEGIGTLGMILNFIVSTVVSKVTAPPPAHIQDLVEHIRVPRGAGAASAH